MREDIVNLVGLPGRWMIDGLILEREGLGWWGALRRRTRGSVSRQIISHCVWLYHRFPLSFREVDLDADTPQLFGPYGDDILGDEVALKD